MRTAYLWTGAASPACQRVARLQPTTDSLPRWSDTLVPVRMRRTLKTFLPLLLLFASAISLRGEQEDEPVANPGRPTVSTPAKITPVGYLQLETGVLAATHSLEFSSRSSLNEAIKFSVATRLELIAVLEPLVHYRAGDRAANGSAEIFCGAQAILSKGEGRRPTVAASYFRRVYDGGAPELDLGSPRNSLVLLASADAKGFHCDANGMLNEIVERTARRAQFGQTLSVSHSLGKGFTLSGEIWHFSQPFLHGHAVGNLWALAYTTRKNLVLDAGFNRGLTVTSTRWEVFAGFTYLFPRRIRHL